MTMPADTTSDALKGLQPPQRPKPKPKPKPAPTTKGY